MDFQIYNLSFCISFSQSGSVGPIELHRAQSFLFRSHRVILSIVFWLIYLICSHFISFEICFLSFLKCFFINDFWFWRLIAVLVQLWLQEFLFLLVKLIIAWSLCLLFIFVEIWHWSAWVSSRRDISKAYIREKSVVWSCAFLTGQVVHINFVFRYFLKLRIIRLIKNWGVQLLLSSVPSIRFSSVLGPLTCIDRVPRGIANESLWLLLKFICRLIHVSWLDGVTHYKLWFIHSLFSCASFWYWIQSHHRIVMQHFCFPVYCKSRFCCQSCSFTIKFNLLLVSGRYWYLLSGSCLWTLQIIKLPVTFGPQIYLLISKYVFCSSISWSLFRSLHSFHGRCGFLENAARPILLKSRGRCWWLHCALPLERSLTLAVIVVVLIECRFIGLWHFWRRVLHLLQLLLILLSYWILCRRGIHRFSIEHVWVLIGSSCDWCFQWATRSSVVEVGYFFWWTSQLWSRFPRICHPYRRLWRRWHSPSILDNRIWIVIGQIWNRTLSLFNHSLSH